jgi:hypothetical protein
LPACSTFAHAKVVPVLSIVVAVLVRLSLIGLFLPFSAMD